MGKIRVKSFGDQEAEDKQAKLAQKRAEAKEAKKSAASPQPVATPNKEETQTPEGEKTEAKKPLKKEKFKKAGPSRSKTYQASAALVEAKKLYNLTEALEILPKLARSKFDETVELHINTHQTGVSGSMTLPHGSGKKTRVVIASEELIAEIEKGQINFDILIAEPSMMSRLAKVAKILGPRGLMPNPKAGTVTAKPDEAVKKYEAGQINFKTEAKSPLLHLAVGKISFGEKKLSENIKTALNTVQAKNIKNVTLKSTMSPGIRLNISSY